VTIAAAGKGRGRAAQGLVLVTGATGFLGGALTRRLLADGARVRVLARSAGKARALADLGAEVITGDITDQSAVRAAVDGARTVYHLAGPLLVPGVPAEEYHRTHVLGTRLVLDSCARAPGLERLVHCSTTGVLGVTGDHQAAEDEPFRPTNDYERAKAEAEAEVRRRIMAGLPAVIARPGLVYGPGDTHLLSFFQAIKRRLFLPIGRRPAWLHPIYIDDMTEALVRCGWQDAALGECFHFAGTSPVTISELARVIAVAQGSRPLPGYLPLPVARAVAGLGDLLPPVPRERAPLTTSRLAFLTHSRMYDIGKARRVLGFAADTDLTVGAARAVAWYRMHGYRPVSEPAAGTPAERTGGVAW
jgi:nucleoside-diphosphate-sugar epimerase